MFKCILSVLLLFVVPKISFSMEPKEILDSLKSIMKKAESEPDFEKKQDLVEQFNLLFDECLHQPNSFNYTFDSVPHLKCLISNDSLVKVFSWAVPIGLNGKYMYYGIIQCKHKNKSGTNIFFLEDTKDRILVPEKEILEYPSWFGCIYYEIIQNQYMGKTVYTLLGFDFNNNSSRKKYIDILSFSTNGLPVFGAPIFQNENGELSSRVIFEYASQSVMLAKYYPNMDKIIFNYLFSIFPEEKDKKYFVPDISYDGYEYKSGKWMYVKDVPMVKEN